MQRQTFTQKLLRQRGFLSYLLPLFALFVGLGAPQTALAQSSIADDYINLNVRGTSNDYNTQSGTVGGSNFTERNFGTFDLSVASDVFILNGGTLIIQEDPSETYDQGLLRVRVFPGTLANNNGAGAFTDIPLTNEGLTGNIRKFTLSNANRDLLASVLSPAGAAPGTSYRFDVRFVANDNVNSGQLLSPLRRSAFSVINARPAPNGATITNPTVIVDQGAGNVSYNASVFNGTTLVDQQAGSTATTSFNINTGQLILKGGTVTTNETGASQVNGAFLDYVVYAPNYASTLTTGTLQLTQNGTGADANGNRTFSLTTGTTNLISLVPTAANGYIISVSYHATYQNGGMGAPLRVDNNGTGTGYNAMFDVDGTKTPPSTVTANTITLDPNGVPPTPPATVPPTPTPPNSDITVYNINPSAPNPFQSANLGTYDVNNGQLLLNNTSVTTTEAGSNTINSVILYYRTRLVGTGGGAFQPITLAQSGNANNGTRTFIIDPAVSGNSIAQPNLIATPAVTAPGNYVVEVYYQANGFNSATGTNFTLTDPPTANTYYTANFTVNGTPIAQTIWTGGKNDNWFDAANWSNGVPNENVNALVRDLGAGVAVPYPNINSDVDVFTAGVNGVFRYSNKGSGPAKTRDLVMGGSSQAARSITRLVQGQLKVYGTFDNTFDSFIQRENTIMEFAGGDQFITGGSFVRVDISGGGTKTLNGIMNVSEALNFLTGTTTGDTPAATNPYTAVAANAGILATDITRPTASVVILSDRSLFNGNNGAQITGETDASFLYGFARTSRQSVLAGETRTYGNMGMTLTFRINSPGNVDVTRNTVQAYSPLSNNFGIRRIFGVRPSDQATNSGGLVADMIFRYRDAETVNLNGPTLSTPGDGSIPEENLIIFVSDNSGNTFGIVGRDGPPNTTANTVTKTGYRGTFATFTLGDTERPLPVRLTAFDAKRIGSDALITWQTANELNSKGYEVQVSTNGTEFRTLSFVGSASPNSTRLLSYSYVDKEANKTGTRYYRLRQIDLDGKQEFFAPKSVSFEGKASLATLVAYPNPFNSNDELHVAVQLSKGGKGQLRVTDMTGRTIRQESVELASGLADVTVGGMKELKAGIYLVRLTLPSGETQNLKVVKQ